MQQLYEKLGVFYLGKQVDTNGEETGLLELIKNKNLTTHAAIIGMTGSGKTGLGIGLLEEAAIDSIPALVIDPKGDMGNLLLTFENLSPEEFAPWVDPAEAAQKGLSVEEYAAKVSKTWQEGIESFYQTKERIKRLKESAEFLIYTPGSSAGISISILSSFDAPTKEVLEDIDSYTYLLSSTTNSLLALLGITEQASSNEAILVANILDFYWKKGESLSLENLIAAIIAPPFKKIGVLPLEGFYPKQQRMQLALKINNIISNPTFAHWMQGEPLDIGKLLYSESGKPKISIMYIAHLGDNERMFFVTLLLNRLISWMRRQSGTAALRALLYMDEIFGYFPPNANPPSKEPMLLLLKQARAFGIGAVLSTQNPVDLDYKGLANIGTWFLGRLQTKQDIARVIDGLLKNAPDALDKKEIETIIANLHKRTFLLRSVHKENLEIFKTRWVLSYLKGPLTKDEIAKLMAGKKAELPSQKLSQSAPKIAAKASTLPILSDAIEQRYDIYDYQARPIELAPYFVAKAKLHYLSAAKGIDITQELVCEVPIENDPIDWENCEESDEKPLSSKAPSGAKFGALPPGFATLRSLRKFERSFADYLYQTRRLVLYKVAKLRLESEPDESLEEFKQRVVEALQDRLQQERDKLQERYEKRFARLHDKLQRAQYQLEKEKEQAKSKTTDTIISLGLTLLDSLFGRKKIKRTTISKAGSTISKAKRAYNEYDDIAYAEERVKELEAQLQDLEAQLDEKQEELEEKWSLDNFPIEEFYIKPRKSDLDPHIILIWKQL